MKKTISAALSAVLAASLLIGSFAQIDDKMSYLQDNGYIKGRSSGVELSGTVTGAEALTMLLRLNDEENLASGEETFSPSFRQLVGQYVKTEENYLILNQGESEICINTESALIKGDISSIKEGDMVSVIADSMETYSIPPITNGYIIVISETDSVCYMEVESVEENDEALLINDKNGNYIAFAGSETIVSPFKTRNILSKDDISAGDKIFVTSSIQTLSLPPQLFANEIIIFDNAIPENSEKDLGRKGTGHWAENILSYSIKAGYIAENDEILSNPDGEISSDKFIEVITQNINSGAIDKNALIQYAKENSLLTDDEIKSIEQNSTISRKVMAMLSYAVLEMTGKR